MAGLDDTLELHRFQRTQHRRGIQMIRPEPDHPTELYRARNDGQFAKMTAQAMKIRRHAQAENGAVFTLDPRFDDQWPFWKRRHENCR